MHPVQIEIFRKMTPEQKMKIAEQLYWSARELKEAVVRDQHPEWTEEQVKQQVKEIFMHANT